MTNLAAPMSGDGVYAESMTEAHRATLKAACAEDSDIWTIFALGFGPDQFDDSFDTIMALPWVRFVLFDEAGELIGMSCFLNIVEERQTLEIGNTYYRPRFRGTGINRRIKHMMMARAFDCCFTRIEYRVDLRNTRSQAAMTKLGAVREGVVRQDRTTWTGHRRDTVLFSILEDEWNGKR